MVRLEPPYAESGTRVITGRPLASVVIPTRNRRASLARTLDALARQDCGPGRFEVVVAANDCTDDTVSFLHGTRYPFKVRVVVADAPGAALARNEGARAAAAPLVIFLDDDIEAWPSFVSAHVSAHGDDLRADGHRVAIGYLPARLQPERDRFAVTLRAWWEAMFDRMREPGHRFTWMDLLSGNCSMARDWFLAVGAFDPRLRCHEDYELGYRLVEAGSEFVFAERAAGWHSDETRVDRACWRKREEGAADAWIAGRHPELRTALPMTRAATARQRLSRWLAFAWPAAGDAGARLLVALLPALDRAGATMAWLRVLYAVLGYWYERGLADALGDRRTLKALLAGAWDETRVRDTGETLDLAGGIDRAAARLDERRPDAVTLTVGSQLLARVPWVPGAERVAGRHLLPLLTRHYHRRLVERLLEHGALTVEQLLAVRATTPLESHASEVPSVGRRAG
jgi:GT2 family glycosyltransferase